MARQRKPDSAPASTPKTADEIPLAHSPSSSSRKDNDNNKGMSDETIANLNAGHQRSLDADRQHRERIKPRPEDVISPGEERLVEAALYTFVLAMLHFTFDVLAQHQYAQDIDFKNVTLRSGIAWLVFLALFYPLHPHAANNKTLLPSLPPRYQHPLRQAVFFVASVAAGCYMIHVTNSKGYLAVMKRAPPLGCLWLWAVVELDLAWAALSLAIAGGFVYRGGYQIK